MVTALPNRGVQEGGSACGDGLKGLPEASDTVWPKTQVQLCMGHNVRHRLQDVPWQARQAVATAWRALAGAATRAEAAPALARFAERWEAQDPAISPRWLAAWDRLTGFFASPPALRRVVSTTKAIESLHSALRQVLKGRRAFPNDASIINVWSRGLQHGAKKWTQPIPEGKAALNQCVILVGERVQG